MKLAWISGRTGWRSTLYFKFMLYYTVTLALLALALTFDTVIVSKMGLGGTEMVCGRNILLAFVLFVFFVLMTSILFSRWITRPLRELTAAINTITREGELTITVPIESEDEIGQLANAFNQMVNKLCSLVKHIQNGGAQVSLSSKDISVASQQQASFSTEQAASVTEIGATIQELATTSKQIAENASSVASLAEQTLASGKSGQETVSDSIKGMDEIKHATQQIAGKVIDLGQKSQAIGHIIEMISGIADKTDLLALNAAIEAAKAGEAGKGFAVLAVEIRGLAENVVQSTERIRELLTEIQGSINASVMAMEEGTRKVEKGSDLANRTGGSLEEILSMIERTTDSIKQIMHSIRQQETASGQVVIAMREIAGVSQQSAANARQTEATAGELAALSENLEKAIEQFKVEKRQNAPDDFRSTEAQKMQAMSPAAND